MSTAADPRVAPVTRDAADDAQRELLEPFGSGEVLNLFTTLAHHPKLMKSWLPFGGRLLLGGRLDDRDREVLILRTAMRCGSDYEWGQHVDIARKAGLADEEILACGRPDPGDALTSADGELVRAADELIDDHRLSDATWATLAERYDVPTLIEVTMLVGHYAMLAGMLSSLRVAPDGPLPRVGTVA